MSAALRLVKTDFLASANHFFPYFSDANCNPSENLFSSIFSVPNNGTNFPDGGNVFFDESFIPTGRIRLFV